MKRLSALALLLVMAFALVACSGSDYKSSYDATMLEKSSGGDNCDAEFETLDGTLVLKARVSRQNYGEIHYEAELHEGEVSVYYDINGTGKQLLFTIKGGERVDERDGIVSRGDKVTFIIETKGVARIGDFDFDFE